MRIIRPIDNWAIHAATSKYSNVIVYAWTDDLFWFAHLTWLPEMVEFLVLVELLCFFC